MEFHFFFRKIESNFIMLQILLMLFCLFLLIVCFLDKCMTFHIFNSMILQKMIIIILYKNELQLQM